MKYDLKELKKRALEASALINKNIPITKDVIDSVSKSIHESAELTKKSFNEATAKTHGIIQTAMEDERTKEVIKKVSSTTKTTTKEIKKYTEKVIDAIDDIQEKNFSSESLDETDSAKNINKVIQKLKAKDKIGMVGERLTAAGGAVAGMAAAGTIASAAGATTLLGSTSLASALGGIFVTTTPVGWVIGSAAIAGAAGYGLAKMVRSGSQQDQVRKEIIERLNKRLQTIQSKSKDHDILTELNQILSLAIMSGLIKDDQGERMIELIAQGSLKAEVALTRIKALAISAGIIETISDKQC